MKAFTKSKYGGPEVLQLEEVYKAALKDDHILVKIFTFQNIPEAVSHIEAMRTKGKVAMAWDKLNK